MRATLNAGLLRPSSACGSKPGAVRQRHHSRAMPFRGRTEPSPNKKRSTSPFALVPPQHQESDGTEKRARPPRPAIPGRRHHLSAASVPVALPQQIAVAGAESIVDDRIRDEGQRLACGQESPAPLDVFGRQTVESFVKRPDPFCDFASDP